MKQRVPVVRALIVAICSLALGGCVYLRLLQLKNQLAQFDRYVEADVSMDFGGDDGNSKPKGSTAAAGQNE